MALPLSPQVFSILASLIEASAGLHYPITEREILADKLSVRALELGFESLLDYYYFLRYDEGGPREIDALVDLLVVNETYFFRESDQLLALVDGLIPAILTRKATVRIWCAACATGEEPLTLSILLEEQGLLDRAEILATDISSRALARAKEGVYAGRSLRAVGPVQRERYFTAASEGTVRVRSGTDRRIQWQRLNLTDAASVRALGIFDVILCRNVLIYFRDETIASMIGRMSDCLDSSGLLLVGASESLLRFGNVFDCEERGGAFFYRKTAQ